MSKVKTLILIISDIIILYGALALTLVLRYKGDFFSSHFEDHFVPFSIIFIVWLIVFYLFDLYRNKNLRIDPSAFQIFIFGIFVSVLSSVTLFYLFPGLFKLTPKTNLVLFAFIFGVVDFAWRSLLVKIFISSGSKNRLLIIGDSPITKEITEYLEENPQAGYTVASQIKNIEDYSAKELEEKIAEAIKEQHLNTVIIQSNLKKNPEIINAVYKLLSFEISILDIVSFYETLLEKIPLDELDEGWFIEKLITRTRIYDTLKRVIDLVLGIILFIILIPFMVIIAILIKLTSRGPILYSQKRMGKGEKAFTLYKFRTMKEGNNGPLWTTDNDKRITFVGKILRRSHLDEFPQLYNIIKGDISFIGPRAERIELAESFRQLPRYEIRHIIKPGLTGWAQLNYKPSASLEEAKEKLEYDIYYIKNKSLILDFLILIKTIKYVFISNTKS